MTDPQDGPPAPLGPAPDPVAPGFPAAAPVLAPLPAELPATSPSSPAPAAEPTPEPSLSQAPSGRPSFLFFGVVAAVSLLADVSTKAWAEITLSRRSPLEPSIELVKEHLAFTLAYNPGGAWGLFQHHSEYVRRPFFLMVSLLAIAFIINLYGRLTAGQRALKWGLPLVLGGALGNLSDRIVRSNVIDFIDYQANWIESMNRLVAKAQKGWAVTNHWPTFNVADIAICVGVGLMAVDMFTSRRGSSPPKSQAPSSMGGPPSGSVMPLPGPLAGMPAPADDPAVAPLPDATEPLKPGA